MVFDDCKPYMEEEDSIRHDEVIRDVLKLKSLKIRQTVVHLEEAAKEDGRLQDRLKKFYEVIEKEEELLEEQHSLSMQ